MSSWSGSLWLYRIGDTNTFSDLFICINASYTQWAGLYLGSDGTTLRYESSDGTNSTLLGTVNSTANRWYHLAFSKNGTTRIDFMTWSVEDGESTFEDTTSIPSPSVTECWVGSDYSQEDLNGRLGACKIWSGVALSLDELRAERHYVVPIRKDGLWFWNPFFHTTGNDHLTDYSGNGNTFSNDTAAPTTEDGPPIAWAPANWRRLRLPAAVTAIQPLFEYRVPSFA
jgi:hypothetical protein